MESKNTLFCLIIVTFERIVKHKDILNVSPVSCVLKVNGDPILNRRDRRMKRCDIVTFGLIVMSTITTLCFARQTSKKPERILSLRKITKRPEWYIHQAGLWRDEVVKNLSDADAWYNYYHASRYAFRFNADGAHTENLTDPEDIIQDMGRAVPDSYEYYLLQEFVYESLSDRIQALEKAATMKPDDPRTYYSLINLYEITRQEDKMKALCRRLYESHDYPSALLDYNYNVLVSVEKNGILFTNGDNDTYPVRLLQHVKGIREDVLVLNIHTAQVLSHYLKEKMEDNGISLDMQKLNPFDVRHLIEQIQEKAPQRNIYFCLTVYEDYYSSIRENLYCTGLVYRYSRDRLDNIAIIKKNMERKYRLDYLYYDWYHEEEYDEGRTIVQLNANYFAPLLILTEHYILSEEHDRVDDWIRLIGHLVKTTRRPGIIDYFRDKYGLFIDR